MNQHKPTAYSYGLPSKIRIEASGTELRDGPGAADSAFSNGGSIAAARSSQTLCVMSSNYGCWIEAYRSNVSSLTSADVTAVKSAIEGLLRAERDRISPYCEFEFRYGGSQRIDGSDGLLIMLSEYWIGDERRNDGCDPEVLVQRDYPLAQEVADGLQRQLGESFQVEARCGGW